MKQITFKHVVLLYALVVIGCGVAPEGGLFNISENNQVTDIHIKYADFDGDHSGGERVYVPTESEIDHSGGEIAGDVRPSKEMPKIEEKRDIRLINFEFEAKLKFMAVRVFANGYELKEGEQWKQVYVRDGDYVHFKASFLSDGLRIEVVALDEKGRKQTLFTAAPHSGGE